MITTTSDALNRSFLFAPGNNERLLSKVFGAGADAVVLDLEDAVPPQEKDRAREMVRETLKRRTGQPGPATYVRINAVTTELWRKDLDAILVRGIAGIRIPKVESAQDVRLVDEALFQAETTAGLTAGSVPLTCTIESAAGVLAAREIARAPRVQGFAYGATDLARDIGADPGRDETETLYARAHLVLVSRATGIYPPVASVQTDLADEDRLRATTIAARRMGFFGRSCIHPKQLPIVHEVFTPSPERVAKARAILESYERAMTSGSGAFTMPDGQFVDEAIAQQAKTLVALADMLERRKSEHTDD